MRRRIALIVVGVLTAMTIATSASAAHLAGPCNGDNTGRDYAQHHISSFAKAGLLGHEGHIPGSHRGFSICLGVHD